MMGYYSQQFLQGWEIDRMDGPKRTILVTGAASGIGRATVERLRAQSHRVIGVDLQGAEIDADLGNPEGRAQMIARARELAPQGLDGVLAGAGVGNPDRPREIVAVNHFGAVATLEGLRPLLACGHRPRAVVISSTSAFMPFDSELVDLCLAGDEPAALARVTANPAGAYPSSKQALSRWLRRASVRPEWTGAGILLNGVAPGLIETPMSARLLHDPHWAEVIHQGNPRALEGYGAPDDVAELLAYLLCFEGRWMLGQIIYIDGGNDALSRSGQV